MQEIGLTKIFKIADYHSKSFIGGKSSYSTVGDYSRE